MDELHENSTAHNTTMVKDPIGGGATLNDDSNIKGDSKFLMESSIGQGSIGMPQGSRIIGSNEHVAQSIEEESYDKVVGSGHLNSAGLDSPDSHGQPGTIYE
jgi:hypothetical protein